MLEILLLIWLCNKNRANALLRGRKPGAFVWLTIGLWVGAEFAGGMIGAAAGLELGAYGLALAFAALGGVTSYFIAKNCKLGNYIPADKTMPPAADGARQAVFCTHCGAPLAADAKFCTACGAARAVAVPAPVPTPMAPVEPAVPGRALWAAGLLFLGWFALMGFQAAFRGRLLYSGDTAIFLSVALLGAGVYLLLQPDMRYKLWGGAAGLVCAVLSAYTFIAAQMNAKYVGALRLGALFSLRDPIMFSRLWREAIGVLLALGVALLVGWLLREWEEKKRMHLAGGAAGGAYVLYKLVSLILQLGRMDSARLLPFFLATIADGLCLYFSLVAVYSLCNMPYKRVRLRGLGLVWAWLALVGMMGGMGLALTTGVMRTSNVVYTLQLVLALAGLAGYVLLLCRRRAGLYVILLGTGLLLGGQFVSSLTGLLYGARQYTALFVGSILGAVNPLLAYLAVRAADKVPLSAQATRPPAMRPARGFQKFAAIFNIAAGGVLVLLPVPFLLAGEKFVGGMALCSLGGLVPLGLGVWFLQAQRYAERPYPGWMRVVNVILFALCAVLLLVTLVGVSTILF